MRLSPTIQRALDECGLPYALERGSCHLKVRVGGRLAAILPMKGAGPESDGRAIKNTVSQIRRAARLAEEN